MSNNEFMSDTKKKYKKKVVIGDIEFIGFQRFAYIYAIRDESGQVKYVGSTIRSIKERMQRHLSGSSVSKHLPIYKWLSECDGRLIVECLDYVLEKNRELKEKFYIKKLKPPLNLTDGGKGMSGYRFAGTEHARKISDKLKTGANFNCLKCNKQFWRKQKDIKRNHNKYCSRHCSNTRSKTNAN